MRKDCTNCGHCWHSAMSGSLICMDGWGDCGAIVESPLPDCDDWIPDEEAECDA